MPIETADHIATLTLVQWLSPSFPIGAFSYSHGLEWLVETGEVSNFDDLFSWLSSLIQDGAGRADVIILSAAYNAGFVEELVEIDTMAQALSPSKERLLETLQQGIAFGSTVNDVWMQDLPELTLPAAIGAAARRQNIPLDATAQIFLHSFASALVSAAIRLVPLGQTEGQKCIAELLPMCIRTVDLALGETMDDIGTQTFLSDIASMNHETQHTRLFRS